ncbi:MAG: hypothetical protein GY884_09185 [Proteobacteria bacterium]|nr:hypothetical protein [Pseudomonadota bacterium]
MSLASEPIFTAYCHCDSCRRAHAAPLYQVVCVDRASFENTAGADLVQGFQKPGAHIVRSFCRACGTRVHNTFPGWTPGGRTPLVFFPATLDEATQRGLPEVLRPTRNNQPQDCVLDCPFLDAMRE